MIFTLISIALLLILSAFFSGSETAMTSTSSAVMHDLEKKEHNPRAKIINKLFRSKDCLIITMLLGSNMSNTLATALSTSVLIELFGNEGVAYATLIMSALILIYTDMLPKSYSVYHANSIALSMAPLINFFVKLFFPLTYILQKIVNISFRLMGLDKKSHKSNFLSEIRGAIYMNEGNQSCQEREMLKGVLDLSEITVYDVMRHRSQIHSLDMSLPIEKIIDFAQKSPFSRLPVYENKPENIVGVIHIKTLLQKALSCHGNYQKLDIRNLMTTPWFIPDTTTLLQQLQLFRKKHELFAIVVDEYGDVQGIVTLEDILEEIVGDINDEYDNSSVNLLGIRQHKGYYIIDGQVTLRDLNRHLGWNFEDENVVTLAGYLLDMTQNIPQTGQKFEFNNFRFEILRRRKNQICKIRVTPPPLSREK